jgi:hypothetical protein
LRVVLSTSCWGSWSCDEKFRISLYCDTWNLTRVGQFATEIFPDDPDKRPGRGRFKYYLGIHRIAFPYYAEVDSRPRWKHFRRTDPQVIELDISAPAVSLFDYPHNAGLSYRNRAPDNCTFDCPQKVRDSPMAVTPLIGIAIDWFTSVSHTKYAHMMTGDLDKEL